MWTVELLPQGDDYYVVIKGKGKTSKDLAERIRRGTERALARNGHPIEVSHEVSHETEETPNQVPSLSGAAGEDRPEPVRRGKKGKNPPAK